MNLVIVPNGNTSVLNQWKDKDFDLWVFTFDDSGCVDKYADKVFDIKDFKFRAIKKIIEENDISQYDYIWCPDDDLIMSSEDISTMFRVAKENTLEIGQPSIDPQSYNSYYYSLRKRKGYELRRTNFIEMQCPFFKMETIDKYLYTFDCTKSGYGVDIHWAFINNPVFTAVIDAVSVKHIRPPYKTVYYEEMIKKGVRHLEEIRKIVIKYGIENGHDVMIIEGGQHF